MKNWPKGAWLVVGVVIGLVAGVLLGTVILRTELSTRAQSPGPYQKWAFSSGPDGVFDTRTGIVYQVGAGGARHLNLIEGWQRRLRADGTWGPREPWPLVAQTEDDEADDD